MEEKQEKGKKSVPIRIVIEEELYQKLKQKCVEHGDLSRLVRYVLRSWIGSEGAKDRDALVKIQMKESDDERSASAQR